MKRFFPLVLGMACSPSTDLVMMRTLPGPQRSPAQMTLLMGDQKPPCDYDEVGEISGAPARNDSMNDSEVLEQIKLRVGSANADGVLGLHKGGMGTVGQGRWQGRVFVCKAGQP
jgi:hypothetical protein